MQNKIDDKLITGDQNQVDVSRTDRDQNQVDVSRTDREQNQVDVSRTDREQNQVDVSRMARDRKKKDKNVAKDKNVTKDKNVAKDKKKLKNISFCVILVLLTLVFLILLELDKNTILGWILALAASIVYPILRAKKLKNKPFSWHALGFACFLLVQILIFFLTQGPYKLVPAVAGKNPEVTDVLHISEGDITGVKTEDGEVEVYTGIPYAAPPVGDLRWKEPQDPLPWDGVLACDHFKPMSMQPKSSEIYSSLSQIVGYHDYKVRLDDNYRTEMSEDSLYVNVWKPAGDVKGCPVLVYVHGGSLQTGQPWYDDYSGKTFAHDGVIVVNMAYRLGVFGYYADEALAAESPNGTTGNYGLLDQVKALEWVQKNIEAFGGDPSNVTLAGESAGSAAVGALSTSPLAKGLFKRVIAESSSVEAVEPAHSFRSMEEALEAGAETRKALKVADGDLAALRALPADKIVSQADIQHHMTVDGYALTKTPYESYMDGEHNEEALLHGYNKEEAAPFLIFGNVNLSTYEDRVREVFGDRTEDVLKLYPAETDQEARDNWEKIFTAYYFGYGHNAWTRLAEATGEPVYEYYFTKDNGRLGSWHSGEEVYLYGNIPTGNEQGANLYTNADLELSENFYSYALNFIRTGNPNGKMSGRIVPQLKDSKLADWPTVSQIAKAPEQPDAEDTQASAGNLMVQNAHLAAAA
ncbi:MAG: carboxylesterase family protein, partial [Lachnospiraceae bacterium]|nr:carboxylesterase family protein [Lachnospiraceae bacterium]